MAAQLHSLQSAVQLSIMNKALSVGSSVVTEMLQQMPEQSTAVHPHKGLSIDVKA